MTPFEAYREYVALKNHFTSKSYDYIKYSGKTKSATPDSYEQRKDKVFFMKLAKHKDVKGFLIANLITTDRAWIGNLAYNEQAQSVYTEWVKRIQSLTYNVSGELSTLLDKFDDNFLMEENSHPYVIKLFLRKEISLETLVILADLARCLSYWNKHMQHDPVWQDISLKIKKYKPFIQYDREKIKQMVLDKFS